MVILGLIYASHLALGHVEGGYWDDRIGSERVADVLLYEEICAFLLKCCV
jgi:hypothetical protein